jgi:predicted O-methyltransferase YrrM
LQTFDNGYFDWVYIDTDHSYKLTRQELEICRDKVKDGGIIAGHDYHMGNWVEGHKYGVIEAVYSFCVDFEWEIIYLTSDIIEASFAIRRLT